MKNAADRLFGSKRALLIAHRGNSSVAPENTLPAFRSALDVGVDGVELDYHHTSKDEPVVFHDKELDRCTDACARWGGEKIRLAEKTFAELRTLDAGAWFGDEFRDTRIPTLGEAIDLIQSRSTTVIERKAGSAEVLIRLLRAKQVVSQVVVIAFDWHFLAECRMHEPELALVALGEDDLTDGAVQTARAAGAQAIGWNAKHLTKTGIAKIQSAGLKAWTWTVDDPERARWLLDQGVQSITTNKPALIKTTLAEFSRRSDGEKERADA